MGATIFPSGFTAPASMRMPEMVLPGFLVFRPLVKGNEISENEIGEGRYEGSRNEIVTRSLKFSHENGFHSCKRHLKV